MPSPATTYDSLVEDIKNYTNRGQATDTTFLDQIPKIITKVEFQLARECKTLISQPPITGTLLPNNPIVEKPARWRNTLYFNITVSVDPLAPTNFTKRKTVYLRPYETLRQYWPSEATTADDLIGPKFYGDYDINHWLVVGTPARAYPYEFIMDERIAPLTVDNQINYFTQFLPDLLLNACLVESDIFLKRWDVLKNRQAAYSEALTSALAEEKDRQSDKTQNVSNG